VRELISCAGSTRKIGKGNFIKLKQQKIRFPKNIGVCGDTVVLRVTVISGEAERQQFAGKMLGDRYVLVIGGNDYTFIYQP
jgi:hypothetical protein